VSGQQWLIGYGASAVGGALALLLLYFSVAADRRRRLLHDLPTSKTTGVFIGLVELQGTAEAERPLTSFLANQACVYFQWSVEEAWSRTITETYTDSDGKTQTRTRTESGWTTVAEGGEAIPFYLQDDCGIIRVQPDRASIEAETAFDETCTPADPLYRRSRRLPMMRTLLSPRRH
jgi:hypothetical protein